MNVIINEISGWGNARDTIQLWKFTLGQRANRVVNNPEDIKTIIKADLEQALNRMISARKSKLSSNDDSKEKMIQKMLDGFSSGSQMQEQQKQVHKFTLQGFHDCNNAALDNIHQVLRPCIP